MQKQKVIFTLISLLSSLIAACQLNFMLLDLNNALYYRRKRKLSSILALSKQICRARLARPRRQELLLKEDFGQGLEEQVRRGITLPPKMLFQKNGKRTFV